MTEVKARALLMLDAWSLLTECSPASPITCGSSLDALLPPDGIVLPPLEGRDRASVAQERRIPVLAPAHAAGARFQSSDAAFHLVLGARNILPIVALHQRGPQIRASLEELGQALAFQLRKVVFEQVPGHLLSPAVSEISHRGIASSVSG